MYEKNVSTLQTIKLF